ncbi:MAG: hypothetical protein KDK45_19350 [Leptospiraceae bacterium]|nr:hypothetical protein [Leptospiraceae bacterium]
MSKISVAVEKELKERYVELFRLLYGTRPSVSGRIETTLQEEIDRMEKELEERQ